MPRIRVVRAIAAMSFRDYRRTPEAIFWTYGFPLVMALVLGLAFARGDPDAARVAVAAESERAGQIAVALENGVEPIEAVELPRREAERRLANGEFDVLVSGTEAEPIIDFDPTRPEARVGRLLVLDALRRAVGFTEVVHPEVRAVTEPGDRYIDFLIPGLIGLNLMGAGLFGVGQNVVMMRVRKMLRRFAVTPMRRSEFLFGFLLSRFLLALPAPVVILLFGMLVFDFPLRGSSFAFVAVVALGAVSFSGLGLLLASRARTIEAVSGLMNMVMLPMWLLGGAFFSNERFPDVIQPIVQAIPLTHLTDALREVSQGGGFAECAVPIVVLAVTAVAFLALALKLFRWS